MVINMQIPIQAAFLSFNSENAKKQSMSIIDKKEVLFNGMEAIILNVTQNANDLIYEKIILVFGDEEGCTFINGLYPKDYKDKFKETIYKSVMSTVYNSNQEIDPNSLLEFELTINESDLKLATTSGKNLLYSDDGNMPSKTKNNKALILGSSFYKVNVNDFKEYATNRVKALPIRINNIREINELYLDSLNAVEIIADGIDQKTDRFVNIYQVIVFEESKYHLLVGTIDSYDNTHIESFRKIAQTFKLKKK